MNNPQLNLIRGFASTMIEDLDTCRYHKSQITDFDDATSFAKLMTLTVRYKITEGLVEVLKKIIRCRCVFDEMIKCDLMNKMKIITKRCKIHVVQINKLAKILNESVSSAVNTIYYKKLIGMIYRIILN